MLELTRKLVAGAYTHEGFPFEKVVEDNMNPERGVTVNPLAQVGLNLLNVWKRDELVLPGLRVTIGGIDLNSAVETLNLLVAEHNDHADLCYLYSTELFKRATIGRMANHFLTLLAAITGNPSERIWTIPLLNDAERAWIEQVSVGAGMSVPADTLLHRLFEKQTQCRPESVVISCDGLHLSYSELNERANRVARHLRSMGFWT